MCMVVHACVHCLHQLCLPPSRGGLDISVQSLSILCLRHDPSQVRMMLAMSVRCNTCGNYMYKGTKFTMRMEVGLPLLTHVCMAWRTTHTA